MVSQSCWPSKNKATIPLLFSTKLYLSPRKYTLDCWHVSTEHLLCAGHSTLHLAACELGVELSQVGSRTARSGHITEMGVEGKGKAMGISSFLFLYILVFKVS